MLSEFDWMRSCVGCWPPTRWGKISITMVIGNFLIHPWIRNGGSNLVFIQSIARLCITTKFIKSLLWSLSDVAMKCNEPVCVMMSLYKESCYPVYFWHPLETRDYRSLRLLMWWLILSPSFVHMIHLTLMIQCDPVHLILFRNSLCGRSNILDPWNVS